MNLTIQKKISNDNSFLKLFSHHSYFFHQGISNDVSDFLGPGSMITIKKMILVIMNLIGI